MNKQTWELPEWCGTEELMMPFVKPASDSDFEKPNVIQAIQQALKRLASNGWKHGDLSRRHVGLYYDKHKDLKCVLFDLAKMKPIDSTKSEHAVASMMKKLSIQ